MSQKEMVLNYMLEHGSITSNDAIYEFGCNRLSARIKDLRNDGVPIKTQKESSPNRFGKKTTYTRYFVMEGVNYERDKD